MNPCEGITCFSPEGVCAICETPMKGAVGHKYNELFWLCSKKCAKAWRKREGS